MTLHVVVVGAGFGGLALARALQQHQHHLCHHQRQLEVCVMDAFDSDSGLISGYLRLPSARHVLLSLGLIEHWDSLGAVAAPTGTASSQARPSLVQIEGLRKVLLESLYPATVRWATRVTDIQLGSDGRVSVCCNGQRWERFDVVVAADGLGSNTRQSVERHWRIDALNPCFPMPAVYAIGDARWVFGRWWDLGLGRIDRGADTALTDAVSLAELLHKSATRTFADRMTHSPVGRNRTRRRSPSPSPAPSAGGRRLSEFEVNPSDWVRRYIGNLTALLSLAAAVSIVWV